MKDIRNERIHRWFLAGLWVILIYGTLSIVRPLTEFAKQYSLFPVVINAVIVIILIGAVALFLKKNPIRQALTYVLLLSVLAAYLFGLIIISIPEERLHFVEYGVLAFLVYRALILDVSKRLGYLLAFIITTLIGLGDEGIQYLLPNRYYQFKDVCLNSISAALGLIFVFVVQRER